MGSYCIRRWPCHFCGFRSLAYWREQEQIEPCMKCEREAAMVFTQKKLGASEAGFGVPEAPTEYGGP